MKKFLSSVVAGLLALTSCTQDDYRSGSMPMGKIQASFEEGLASRLAVGEENTLTWSTGDAFTMFNSDGESSQWTLEGEGGKTEGTFGGMELEGDIKGAAFPSSAVPTLANGYELTMTLPATLTYEEGICNLPMWASFSSLEDNIAFRHLGALLKIDFTNIPEDYNELIVTANKAIAGTFTTNIGSTDPVLTYKENGSKSVTISFEAVNGEDNNRMFYLPLPVGTYGSINVSISDGENTISIADWKDRTIERKKVYFASLTYRELSANESEPVTPEIVTEALSEMASVTPNATVEIIGAFEAEENVITIPAELSKVNLNFAETPTTGENAPLTIEESTGAAEGTQLTVNLPASTEAETYLEINTPTTTVNVEGGNYKKIVATTADNTLILREGTIVFDLVVVAGNISFKGGKVTGSITRHDPNTGEVTFIYVDSMSDLLGLVLGQEFEVVMPEYITFTAEAEQTFSFTLYDYEGAKETFQSKEVETIEYSVNGGKWTELGTSTVTFGGSNGDLRLRGKSMYGTERNNGKAVVTFGNADVPVACTGDIRTLIDYEKYNSDELDTSHASFRHLFYECTNLTSAPKLPMTTAKFECYASMFKGCTSLEEAPELPATTLEWGCYFEMFYSCTSLKKAPALPATTLAPNCYSHMFYGCTGLEEAPELPATSMDNNQLTYYNMFYGCTSLKEAPALPATKLTWGCYWGMFEGCTSLTKAPVLPAEKLESQSYQNMFYGCTNLNEVTMLATDISGYRSMYNWLVGTAATGTITKATNIEDVSAMGIPEKWTIKNEDGTNFIYNSSYLTFSAEGFQTLTMTKAVATLEYSVGGSPWTELGTNTVTFGALYGNLRLRGKNLQGTAVSTSDHSKITFAYANTPVACTGDIRMLLDYENYETVDTKDARFCSLFYDCRSLSSAPELPATVLASHCYDRMFGYCALTSAPVLPATTLAEHCYDAMFIGCSKLTSAPVLPATTMADWCYLHMFYQCTSLTEAPALPATTLAEACYYNMFGGCTSLTEAPALPATTLALQCYERMFESCKALTQAPELPATTLADYCYNQMFTGCTSLTEAPELPATTLAESYGYFRMFAGCTSLKSAPKLPATTLTSGAYFEMFYGCTSLTEAPELPAMKLTMSGYRGMFEGCTSLTKAPELPATELDGICYYRMFAGCTSLIEAPELPATTLVHDCYANMFDGCTNLSTVTMLATDVTAENCLTDWLTGTAATGTFYKSASIEDVSSYGIPEGWEVKNYSSSSNAGGGITKAE